MGNKKKGSSCNLKRCHSAESPTNSKVWNLCLRITWNYFKLMLVYLFNLGRFWYLPGTFKGGKLKQKKTLCVTLSKQRIKVIQWALLIGSMKGSWNIGVAFCLLLILSHSSFNEVHSLSVFYLITIFKKTLQGKRVHRKENPVSPCTA